MGIPALYGLSWRLCGYLMNEYTGSNPYDSIWGEWLVSVFVTNIRNLWSHIVLNSSERALLKALFIPAVSVVSLLTTYEMHHLISTIVSHSSHPYGFMERNIPYDSVEFFKNWYRSLRGFNDFHDFTGRRPLSVRDPVVSIWIFPIAGFNM